jgi:hypothetical protein
MVRRVASADGLRLHVRLPDVHIEPGRAQAVRDGDRRGVLTRTVQVPSRL